MRKIFTTLKSVVAATIIASMTLAASCSYDDTAVKNQLQEVKQDLAALTERVAALENRLTEEVNALTALINEKAVVTDVKTENGVTTITLSDGTSFTINHPSGSSDTTVAPYQHTDGVYYWAVFTNNQFVEFLSVDGAMVPVYSDESCDCVAGELVFDVDEDGNLLVSIDGGITWVNSGISASNVSEGSCIFTAAVVNENGTVTFTLADGSQFTVAMAELIEFSGRDHAYIKAEEVKQITFTINDAVADINIMNQPLGWKATVEAANNAEPSANLLAAGGKEFVLTVTGPSSELVQAGIADKSGLIQIHFNTPAGACKVAKLAVDLAELALEVDNAGNITVTNTLVSTFETTDWLTGETTLNTDFHKYYIGVMPIDEYSGDLRNDLEVEYKDSAASYNSNLGYYEGFFAADGTSMYEPAYYMDGVCEVDVLKTTVEALVNNFSYGYFEYAGESFIVFAVPQDMNTGANLWDEAIIKEFKQLNVSVVEREDLRSWNNVYFDAKLRGASMYQLNPQRLADMEMNVENGSAESVEDYFYQLLLEYLQQPQWYQFGYKVTSDVVEEGIALNELLNYGAPYMQYFELAPATEYVLAIFAEEEGKTEYTIEDLKFVYFTTNDIVEAETAFEYTLVANEEDTNYFEIAVDVTVPEEIVTVYSKWYTEEQLELDVLKQDLVNGYARTDFEEGYTYTLSTSADAAGQTKYLAIMMVDAAGNYTIAQQPFASKSVVLNEAVVTIDNVEFAADGLTVTLGGIEGLEVASYRAYVIATDGMSYYQRTEEQLQDLAYASNYMYREYQSNPFVVTQTADYKYTFTEGKTYKVAAAVQFADGTVSNTAYGEYGYNVAPVEPVAPIELTSAVAVINDNGYPEITFSNETIQIMYAIYPEDGVTSYLHEKKYGDRYKGDTDTSKGSIYTISWPGIMPYPYYMDVAIVDGVYDITLTAIDNNTKVEHTAHFKGDIEGMGYEGAVELEDSAAAALVTDTTFNGYNPYDVTFTFATGAKLVVRFNTNGAQYIHLGNWQSDNWQDPHYISTVQLNGAAAYASACNVAYENDAYNVAISVYDYSTYETINFNYVGAIEGLNAPEACDCLEGVTEWTDVDTVFNVHSFNVMSGYSSVTFTNADHNFTTEFNHVSIGGDVVVLEGTYTLDTSNTYPDFSATATQCDGRTPQSGSVVVTNNGDGTCTFTIDFAVDGCSYKGTYTGNSAEFLGAAGSEGGDDSGDDSGDDAGDGVVLLTEFVGSGAADDWSTYFHFKDASGDNQVKFVCENQYVDTDKNFPRPNDFTEYKTSVPQLFGYTNFAFMNGSLIVDGTTYKNDEVSNATAIVTETSITITFTVGGAEHVFQHNL